VKAKTEAQRDGSAGPALPVSNVRQRTERNMIPKSITDLPDDCYAGHAVFVRVDFNVPLADGQIREDYRLRRTIPTIEYLSRRGAKVILASHLGKPKGKRIPELSLKPIANRLSSILHVPTVKFVEDIVGESVNTTVNAMKSGEVLLLENLRFDAGEEANDPAFCAKLATLAEIYVNEAFGTMHRAHASTYGAAQLFQERLAGFLVKKEIEILSKVRDQATTPFIVVVGGIKIKDKLSALKTLLPKADRILLGGGIAFTFLAAQAQETGDSPVEEDYLPWAQETLAQYGQKLFLPQDHVIARALDDRREVHVVQGTIPNGFTGFDIGPETTLAYTHELMRGEGTMFWNGPLGAFEKDEFAEGTVSLARAMALAHWRGATTVIGGGDTVAALRKAEVVETEVSHVSTGGGASLKYLGGENLPGLSVLTVKTAERREVGPERGLPALQLF
jgi:phosphoglycerate kinase